MSCRSIIIQYIGRLFCLFFYLFSIPNSFNMKMFKRLLLTFFIFSWFASAAQTEYTTELRKYSIELYASFSKKQQQSALLSFADTSRLKWNNLPVGLRARVGTSVGNMSNDQRRLLHRILSAALSSQGYLKATGIMHLDELINRFYDSLHVQKAFSVLPIISSKH